MKRITLSVIIPTWNRSNLIPTAINSVLNQTYKDWELIIVDDGSTDNTEEVIRKFQTNDTRIKFIKHKENSGGCSAPKNTGVKNALGNYIAFLDSDDEWLPTKLEEQLDLFKKSTVDNLGFVGCRVIYKKSDGSEEETKFDYQKGNCFDIFFKNVISIQGPSSVIVKKECFEKVGLFDENLKSSDDHDMWLKLSHAGYGFDFSPKYLTKYSSHPLVFINPNFNTLNYWKEYEYIYKKYGDLFYKDKTLQKIFALGFYNAKDYSRARKYLLRSPLSFKNVVVFSFSIIHTNIYNVIKNIKKYKYGPQI